MKPPACVSVEAEQLVVFGLGQQQYALRLLCVEKIIRAVEITPLPKAPRIVQGVINIRGQIVPVLDIRSRFGIHGRDLFLSDVLIVAHTAHRTVALAVDKVTGVVTRPAEEVTEIQKISPSLEYVVGVVKLEDGLVFIHDLDAFLSLQEEALLETAMASTKGAS